jgi:hypothetical protein
MQGSVAEVMTAVVGLGGWTASRLIVVRPGLLSAMPFLGRYAFDNAPDNPSPIA